MTSEHFSRSAPALAHSARTRIKICGLRTDADVDAAVAAGADAIGFVFYEKSPRYVTIEQAAVLAARLPPFVTPVGLFVDAPRAMVRGAIDAIPTLTPQFHGDETPEQCRAAGRRYIRAARIGAGFHLVDFAASYVDAFAVLLDAHVEGYGGGGKVFDWSLIATPSTAGAAAPGAGRGVAVPLVLSGGLHAANVADGIRQLRPWAVDVSSGVESSRGVKSADMIQRFCEAVREADLEASSQKNHHAPLRPAR